MPAALKPGHTSIARAHPYEHVRPDGTRELRMGWMLRVKGEDRARGPFYTTMKIDPRIRPGSDAWKDAEKRLRARARRKADKVFAEAATEALRRAEAGDGEDDDDGPAWTLDDPVRKYIDEVSVPAIEGDPELRESSKRRYLGALRDVEGILKRGVTIRALCHYRAFEDLLKSVNERHGTATAKRVRSVMNNYVFGKMIEDELIQRLPIEASRKVKLGYVNRGTQRRARSDTSGDLVVVEADERAAVIGWLLSQDARKTAPEPGHGIGFEQSVWQREGLILMTLVQATCGLRYNECRNLQAKEVSFEGGVMRLSVVADKSKTGRPRDVPMFDPVWGQAVTDRMRRRLLGDPGGDGTDALAPEDYVFGSCRDHAKPWGDKSLRGHLRAFYDELSDQFESDLEVRPLHDRLTHVWRASLNKEYRGVMTKQMRSDLFGHTTDVNETSYTAKWDVSEIMEAAGGLADPRVLRFERRRSA